MAALLISYLVAFVVADHWFFAEGVPRPLRLALLIAVAAVALGWFAWRVVWPYLRRVNDLYAARMLEQAEPHLRGSLFGLVDSRRAGRPAAEEVRRALEKRAATALSSVDVDSALDRRPLMRTAYVLLAVVLVACAYAVLSPKRVGPSLLRALVPSAQVGVATRTEILDVRPGDAVVLAGTELEVAVMIRGEAPEQVMLFYSTSDRRFANEPIEMRLHDESTREYRAALVGDAGRGLTQDLNYRIEANDDAAGPFAVRVEQPPAATVTSVALQFPPYTGLAPVERDTPPIDAIAGTNVAVTAKANRPLKSAKLVFADDERFLARGEEVPLRIAKDGVTLEAAWKLAIRSDGSSPTFYRIECRDTEGKTNPNPVIYPIAIRPDQPPEVILHDPKSDLERPANAIIPLLVTARDPDFQLRELTLRLEKGGQELPERTVLWEGAQAEAAVRHNWDLAPLGLKPGDVLSFYVQARDNREPEFNRRNTAKLNVTITEPVAPEEVEQQLADDRQRQDQELAEAEQNEAAVDRPGQPEGAEPDPMGVSDPAGQAEGEKGEGGEGEQAAGESGAPGENERRDAGRNTESTGGERGSSIKNDGSQDDAVLRRLLERQQENKDEPRNDAQQNDQQQQDGKQPGETQPPPEQQQGGQSSDSQQNGAGDGKRPQKQDGAHEGGEQPTGNQPGGSSGDGQQPSAGEQSTEPHGDSPNGSGKRPPDKTNNEATGASGETGDKANGNESGPQASPQGDASNRPQGATGEKAGTSKPNPSTAPSQGGETQGGQQPAPGEAQAGQKNDRPQETGSQRSQPGAADGTRTGEQPRPNDGGELTPSASDNERTPSDPGRPRANDGPPGATDRNPGEGRPDQRSQQPDSGEQGSGQPNADGTPDGRPGPGDAGTRPGSQQPSDRPTGQPGDQAARQGQPGESGSAGAAGEKAAGQPQPSQPEKGASGQPTNEQSQEGQKGSQQAQGQQAQGQQAQGQQGQGAQSGKPQETAGGEKGESGSGESSQNQAGEKGASGQSGQQGDPMQGSQEGQDGQQSGKGEAGQENGAKEAANEAQGGQQGEQGAQSGEQAGQSGQSGQGNQPGQGGQAGNDSSGKDGQGAGQNPGNGGASGARSAGGSGDGQGAADDRPDEANADYAKQATDLALKQLEDELKRGEVDSDLLNDLGWTEEDMRRFAERLRKNLAAPTGDETPQDIAQRKEFEHMLENLPVGSGPSARTAPRDRVRNVEGVGTVNPAVPSEYRDAFEAFTRSVAGRRQATEGNK